MVHIISRCGANTKAISLAKEIWSFEQSGKFPCRINPVGLLSLFLSLFLAKNPCGDYGNEGLGHCRCL